METPTGPKQRRILDKGAAPVGEEVTPSGASAESLNRAPRFAAAPDMAAAAYNTVCTSTIPNKPGITARDAATGRSTAGNPGRPA